MASGSFPLYPLKAHPPDWAPVKVIGANREKFKTLIQGVDVGERLGELFSPVMSCTYCSAPWHPSVKWADT